LRDFQPEFLDSLLTPEIFYPYLAILKGIFKKFCLKGTINAEKTEIGNREDLLIQTSNFFLAFLGQSGLSLQGEYVQRAAVVTKTGVLDP
jgi:hypothetical protein